MAEQFLFRFDEEGLDRIIQRVEEFRRHIREVGQAGELGEGFQRFFNQFIAGTRQSLKTVRDLRSQIVQLQTELASARFTTELEALSRFRFGERVTEQIAGAVPGLKPGEVSTIGVRDRVQAEAAARLTEQRQLQQQLGERINALNEETIRLEQIQFAEEQRLSQERQRQANLAEYTNRLEATRASLLARVRDIRPGGTRLRELTLQRENELTQRQIQLREQLAETIARFSQGVPREAAALLKEEISLTAQVTAAKQRQVNAEREIAQIQAQAAALDLKKAGRFAGTASEAEVNALLEVQNSIRGRLAAAREEELRATVAVTTLEQQRAANLEQMASIESGGTGLSRGATEVLNRLRQINQLLTEFDASSDVLGDVFGEDIQRQLAEVEADLAAFEGRDISLLDPAEGERLSTATIRARELLQTVDKFPTEGIPLRLNEEELLAGVSLLNRVLLGAARDFGRRFTATLQFAISGALLFGTQRLLRQFFDAAVEVERTFADISTSLEFDIQAERGTAEFERALERVRRQVLQIADDFNTLPTEVNAAAFQMVSRFGDVEAAMIATRAQVLATRVATISQAEALRALTGVAEAYSLTLSHITDDQERQRRQAQLYADALDKATIIQQRFGISVEDVLEGAGGIAELFRTLGFTIDETFAIVAATVRRTTQTGAQVSDRLGRAFSSIETEEVRNELLALANDFDEFFLRPIDFFEGGREVFFQIADQFASLDQQLQNRIAQIIGQRRETAFVTALFQAAGEGLVGDIIDQVDDATGAAENRLGTLLATVQGTIEGISTEFQELAQNLERLGIITPIRLLLSGLELILKTLNALTTGLLNLVELFNRIRLPGTDFGLGSALTAMIGLLTAAASFRGIIKSITFIAQAKGATTLIDVFRSLLGLNLKGAPSRATDIGVSAAGVLGISSFVSQIKVADGLIGKVGAGLKTLFIAPFVTLLGLLNTAKITLGGWVTALITGQVATGGAITTEIGLQLARARTAVINGILTIQQLGLAGILARVGPLLAGFVLRLGGVARAAFLALGAFTTFRVALGAFSSIAERIFSDQEGPSGPGALERRAQIKAEAEAAGRSVSDAEAAIQQLEERASQLRETLEGAAGSLEADFRSFGLILLGLGSQLKDQPGTRENIEREERQVGLELAFANAVRLQAEVGRLNAALGFTGDELAPSLQDSQQLVNAIFNALVGIDAIDPDPADLEAAQRLLDQARAGMETAADLLGEWGEVMTAQEIRDEINSLQTNIQLGFRTLAGARQRLRELRADAIQGLAQAQAGGDPAAIKEAERVLLDIALTDQQVFEQERDARLDRAALIEDNRIRTLAELRILRDFAEAAANNPNLGLGAVRQAQQAVVDAEHAYNNAILEEAVARRQFEVDTARTFTERIAAFKRLLGAINAQIAARIRSTAEALVPDFGSGTIANIIESVAASVIAVSGIINRTAAEDAQVQAILDQIADEQLRYAQLVARNSTLKNKSSLDNIAAIAATANALRAEIQLLRQRGADEQEILAKEIELRDTVAQQRLAEADRRAAFFRLTAGTGDEIRAAQAELRAAQDRLATVTALGGAETQQGYEAELAVLQARRRLVDLALRQADLSRRVASDLTDSFEQSLLDVQAAQEALRRAAGDLEKLEAQKALAEAESRAQREFYDRRLSDLDFLFQTDQLGRTQYIAALRSLQAGIDRTTRQGEELWREIEIQIRGLMEDANQAFNIPTEIQLPTLFEVRRALAADALGVNYQDMRQQEINIFVSDEVDINAVIAAIESSFGGTIDLEAQRLASGGAGITIGGFN